MRSTQPDAQVVSKEEVAGLTFPAEDVLPNGGDKSQRLKELERAMSLGNLQKVKVKIHFSDDKGKKAVETTVWGLTDKRVILKGGAHIPIHRVYSAG